MGLTMPWSVAEELVTLVAAPVVTIGGPCVAVAVGVGVRVAVGVAVGVGVGV